MPDSTVTITEAEAHVMAVLWTHSPQSTEDVALALQGRQDWQLSTIKTLLGRLLNKAAISAEKDGKRYLYSPVLQRQDWLKTQSLGLLDRWFDGKLTPLVAHFAAHRRLKPADIKELQRLLKELERG